MKNMTLVFAILVSFLSCFINAKAASNEESCGRWLFIVPHKGAVAEAYVEVLKALPLYGEPMVVLSRTNLSDSEMFIFEINVEKYSSISRAKLLKLAEPTLDKFKTISKKYSEFIFECDSVVGPGGGASGSN